MTYTETQINEILSNCYVLILEDDKELSDRIKNLIGKYTQDSPIIAHSVEEARKIVSKFNRKIDLVILDIMLPEVNSQYIKILELEESLKKINETINNVINEDSEEAKKILFTSRYERSLVIQDFEELINNSAGVNLVDEWRKDKQQFPILFLTAVGDNGTVENALSIAGENSSWIIKPSNSQLILKKCIDLLIKWKKPNYVK